MLSGIRTNDFEMDTMRPFVASHSFPLIPAECDGIARVGHDTQPQAQVIGRHAVGQTIAFAFDLIRTQIPQGLFDGINA
jgi:hypothetical protein